MEVVSSVSAQTVAWVMESGSGRTCELHVVGDNDQLHSRQIPIL
jgi:hypothetical protein